MSWHIVQIAFGLFILGIMFYCVYLAATEGEMTDKERWLSNLPPREPDHVIEIPASVMTDVFPLKEDQYGIWVDTETFTTIEMKMGPFLAGKEGFIVMTFRGKNLGLISKKDAQRK